MTIREALSHGASVLSGTGSETPYLDASLLLARALGCDRSVLLARNPDVLSLEAEPVFLSLLLRRAEGESIAYILGKKEFFGRTFRVDSRVLVPRPETEILVEAALETARRILPLRRARTDPGASSGGRFVPVLRVHDAFTGSGCVGISLAAELPNAEVSLSDLSPGARELAAWNAREILGRDLPVLESDVLAGAPGTYDLITANPPYVASARTDQLKGGGGERGSDGILKEPRIALDGGTDGLAFYRRLVPEAEKVLAPGGGLVIEIGEDQAGAVKALFSSGGFLEVEVIRDLGCRDRVVRGLRHEGN